MPNVIQSLEPVFTSIRESIARHATGARAEAAELRGKVAELERQLADVTTTARDALAAMDITRAEVELMRALYATQTREVGELVRALVSSALAGPSGAPAPLSAPAPAPTPEPEPVQE